MSEAFYQFVAHLFQVPRETLCATTAYESIPQWDSIMHLRLVMEVEAHMKCTIPLEVIPSLRTLQDFAPFVTSW